MELILKTDFIACPKCGYAQEADVLENEQGEAVFKKTCPACKTEITEKNWNVLIQDYNRMEDIP